MDVREKLVELIAKAKYICANDYSDHTEDEYIADTLLDNGVTVDEWISVKDRLPDVGVEVLVYSEIDGICVDYYDGDVFGYFDITHWMPMPKPPKGV